MLLTVDKERLNNSPRGKVDESRLWLLEKPAKEKKMHAVIIWKAKEKRDFKGKKILSLSSSRRFDFESWNI